MKNSIAVSNNDSSASIRIANSFIQAKKKTNLLQSKLELLAIRNLNQEYEIVSHPGGDGKSVNTYKCIKFKVSEIKGLLNRNDGNIYNDVKKAAINLLEKHCLIEDKEKDYFRALNVYHEVKYDKGVVTIEFEPETEQYFFNLTKSYTKLSLPLMFSFLHNGAFQLYKLLATYIYKLPQIAVNDYSQEDLPCLSIDYDISQLRVDLGFVNVDKKQLTDGKINPIKFIQEDGDMPYKRWGDFMVNVITPGINEINEKSDIYIKEMKQHKSGYGGKVTSVSFIVQRNINYGKEEPIVVSASEITEEKKMDILDDIIDIIPIKLKLKEYNSIAEIAGYDIGRVKKACEIMEQTKEVENVYGFLTTAIKNNWDKGSKYENKKGKNSFQNFPQRDYSKEDYESMEKILLSK